MEGVRCVQLINNRRNLHQIPELGLCLPKTIAYLTNSLSSISCEIHSPIPSSLAVFFDYGAEDAIAFRADCDALPIQEINDHCFTSLHHGVMHACGHDGHMAILLELAHRFSKIKSLNHNVLILFQPGEESPGGAKLLCETQVLSKYNVKAIFGLHLWPGLTKGKIFSREGALMSSSSDLDVNITGQSAHIGRSWEGIDALAAAVDFYTRVVKAEQSLPADVHRLLKFGRFKSGQARNAVPDMTRLEGSLRVFHKDVFVSLENTIRSIASEIQNETGCKIDISIKSGYPAVINPSKLSRYLMKHFPYNLLEMPTMASEDFAWYQQYIPGMFYFLGIGPTPALHSSNFDFDESVLEIAVDYFEDIAVHIDLKDVY